MAYTFLSASFTKTYFAPCSLTHLTVHSALPSLAPAAPQALSEMYPVQVPSAPKATAPAKRNAAAAVAKRSFITIPPSEVPVVLGLGLADSLSHAPAHVQSESRTAGPVAGPGYRDGAARQGQKKRRALASPPLSRAE